MNWDGSCEKDKSILKPRKEFTEKLEALLLEEARKIKRKQQVKHRISRNMQFATALALVIGITTSTGKLVQLKVASNPSEHLTAPASREATPYNREAVEQPDQLTRERKINETVATIQTDQNLHKNSGRVSKPAQSQLEAEVKQNVQQQPLHSNDQNRSVQDGVTQKMKEDVKKLYNVDLSHFRLNPRSSEKSEGHFVFERTVNGIPVWGESLTLSLLENGSIGGVKWETIDDKAYQESYFPEPTGTLSLEELKHKLKEYVRLVYFEAYATTKRSPFSQSVLEKTPVLTYQFHFNGSIDAFSGKPNEQTQMVVADSVSPFFIQSGGGLFIRTEEEARVVMNTFFETREDGDLQIISESILNQYRWVEKNGRIVTLQTDRETGRVIGLEVNGSYSNSDNHVLASHSLSKKAVSVLEPLLGPEIKEVQLERTIQKEHQTEFCFVPLHHGIPVIDRTFFITLNNQTGDLLAIRGDFAREPVALPSQQQILSIDDALTIIMNHTQFELMYSWTHDSGNKEKNPLLVYRQRAGSSSRVTMDAKTGEILHD